MLSDSPIAKTKKSTRARKASDVKAWYSDNQKLEAVKAWLVIGNLAQVAAALNINYETLMTWKRSQWWSEMVTQFRSENSLQLSAKLRKIAEKALDVTLDRLENGDFFYDQKRGELVRKPVNMREAASAAQFMVTAHISLEKNPKDQEEQKQVIDRLEELKRTFERFARPKVEVTDIIEVPSAIHEERKEGLREGESLGSLPQWRFPAEGPSEPEQSESDVS